MTGADGIAILILATILIAIGVYLLHWLYRHSSKDESFVRTGMGGERVVMGGGALVIPIIHTITPVRMNAIPVEIRRTGENSLITRNKMRIDLVAEFFARVIPTKDGVSIAARNFGSRLQHADQLKEIVQGRFIDAMSAVAATMTMEEIHSNRNQFMRDVSALVAKTLGSNGLELENASLISLNQSDISVFNPANAFDAEGLTQLTGQIEERRKLRNQIENDTRLEIMQKDFEAEQRALTLNRDLEYARIEQTQELETRKAAQAAAIEDQLSSSAISIHNARVRTEQESERVRIARDRLIDAERINSVSDIKNLEIERQRDNELHEINLSKSLDLQRIANRKEVDAERIETEHAVREFEIKSRQDISVLESNATAQIDTTRLESEKLVETSRIETSRVIEMLSVERDKQIRISNELAAGEQEKATIAKRYSVDLERLKKDEEIVHLEIAKNQKIKLAETTAHHMIEDAQIATGRDLDELRIAARNYVEKFEIEQQKELEITDKERLIAVINKSIEEAYAKTEAAQASKVLAAVEEEVVSAKEEEIANRVKRIELIDATSKAERETLRVVSAATAEKIATEQRALAEIAEANASEVRYAKDAEGQRVLNDAENMRSDESRRSAIYENLIKSLPSIIRETVKPMENIESIKILQVDGVPGINSPSEMGGGGGDDGGSGNMTDRVMNSAMKYRTQVAFVDGLMADLGLPMANIGSAGGMSFRNFAPPIKGAKEDGED